MAVDEQKRRRKKDQRKKSGDKPTLDGQGPWGTLVRLAAVVLVLAMLVGTFVAIRYRKSSKPSEDYLQESHIAASSLHYSCDFVARTLSAQQIKGLWQVLG